MEFPGNNFNYLVQYKNWSFSNKKNKKTRKKPQFWVFSILLFLLCWDQ